jgi:hypothetical protein
VRPARAAGLVPFFGEIVPKPLRLGDSLKGQLGFNQEAYYQATLSIGAYDAILEFARITGDPGLIFGSLGWSSFDAGGWVQLLYFQDSGRSQRKSARFAVSEPGPIVFTVLNTGDVVDYIFPRAASRERQPVVANFLRKTWGDALADCGRAVIE